MSVLHGSCLCRGVRFEITGPLIAPSNCHCSICRKQHGAAFWSRARVRPAILTDSGRGIGDFLRVIAWQIPRLLPRLRLSDHK